MKHFTKDEIDLAIKTLRSRGYDAVAAMIEQVHAPLNTKVTLAPGDRVRYLTDEMHIIKKGDEGYIISGELNADGHIGYSTTDGAWFARTDLELLEEATTETLMAATKSLQDADDSYEDISDADSEDPDDDLQGDLSPAEEVLQSKRSEPNAFLGHSGGDN